MRPISGFLFVRIDLDRPDTVIISPKRHDGTSSCSRWSRLDHITTARDYDLKTSFGTGTRFETIVTDNNKNAGLKGAIKHTFKDVRELITSVREDTVNGPIWTSYGYDALKQITQVTDDKGNVTTVAYDNFGRRTSINNPDTGATSFAYDLASNLTQKITANLQANGQAINYDYDFNRLVAVRYPTFTANNVAYSYGAPGAPNNSAGRITKVVTHTTATSQGNLQDLEERQYGKLGEVVYEKKTVVTFTDPLHPSVFETRFAFDTFGRLQTLIYPDGEVLTNTYDSGGNLTAANGIKNGYRYDYLKRLSYDKFEQRVLVEAGNNVKTAYTYDARTRRLSTLTAGKAGGNLFQSLSYSYDNVGNILNLKNQVDVPPASSYGGPTNQTFVYDELYRLTHGEGTFQFAPDKTHTYAMDQTYDSIHNILTKHQLHTIVQPSTTAITQKKTSYDFTYAYNASGSGSIRPHAPNHIGDRTYSYDLNGNQTGWTQDTNGTRRTILWNEENRAESITDNGQEKDYKYDDQGTRTIKRGPQGETVYVNQFFTQRPGATGTKHVYAGTSRIVSKLVKQDSVGANPNGNTPFEKDLFFYHPDHLGSSNYITDTNGKLYEHLEYFPFGETWVHENSNTQRTPYLFTAKELDEETGLYYYGARYYDPRTSVWQSADPILDKYLPTGKKEQDMKLPGMGGVFEPKNLGMYTHTQQNPLRFIDPNGTDADVTYKKDGSISIEIPINFSGPGATPANVSKIKSDISNAWSGTYTINGKATKVSVTVTTPTAGHTTNNISLTTGPTSLKSCSGCSYVRGGNSGEWDTTSSGMAVGEAEHEAGHLMGEQDHYRSTYDSKGVRTGTAPDSGYVGNLMGQLPGKTNDANMTEILQSKKNTYTTEK